MPKKREVLVPYGFDDSGLEDQALYQDVYLALGLGILDQGRQNLYDLVCQLFVAAGDPLHVFFVDGEDSEDAETVGRNFIVVLALIDCVDQV